MTNEELAKHIECGDAILREAAARLRKHEENLTKCDKCIFPWKRQNDDLRTKLKVAEDALSDVVPHLCARCTIWDGGPNCCHDVNLVDCVGGKVRRALAAIREEGGYDAN